MNPALDFAPAWTVILGATVFFYVLLRGFDLCIGILAPVAPVWDSNESWLVFRGVGLLAAFRPPTRSSFPARCFCYRLSSLILGGVTGYSGAGHGRIRHIDTIVPRSLLSRAGLRDGVAAHGRLAPFPHLPHGTRTRLALRRHINQHDLRVVICGDCHFGFTRYCNAITRANNDTIDRNRPARRH